MKKSNLIWGLICFAIAAVLTVANLRLPAEDLMFKVGDVNMPWVPPVVLAIVGVILLATAGESEPETSEQEGNAEVVPEKAALNKQLETIAWGCFLILLGGFMFVPGEIIRGGWWSIGVGLIMLGLNAARYLNGLKMSGFTTFLGVVSIIGGALEVAGLYAMNGAIFILVLGAYLLLKPTFDKRQLFGKAEEA